MRLILDNSSYMVFEIWLSYQHKNTQQKIELQIYDKHMCTETILLGDRAIECQKIVNKFKKDKKLDINDALDEFTIYSKPFDVH